MISFAIRYLVVCWLGAFFCLAAIEISANVPEGASNRFGPALLTLLFPVFVTALAGYYGYVASRHANAGASIGFATGITAVTIEAAVLMIGTMMHRMRPSGYAGSALDPQDLQDLLLFRVLLGACVVLAFTVGGYVHGRWPARRPPVQPTAEPDDRDVLFALGWAWPTKPRPAAQDDDDWLDDLDPDWIFRIQLYLEYGRYADETDDLDNTPLHSPESLRLKQREA